MKSKKKTINTKEPPPKKNDRPAIWDLIISEMKERDRVGTERYGMRLQSMNGRNSPVDALQEHYDLIAYTRQWVEERKEMVEVLKEILDSNAYVEMTDELYWKIENTLKKLGEL